MNIEYIFIVYYFNGYINNILHIYTNEINTLYIFNN